jgi:hypothetical protein
MMSLVTLSASATAFWRRRKRQQKQRRPSRVHCWSARRGVESNSIDQAYDRRPRGRPLRCRERGLERFRIDAFGLKACDRCIDLALGLRIKTAAEQGANEFEVNRLVERRDVNAFPQDFDAIIALRRQDGTEPLEKLQAQLTEAVPLAGEPVFERRSPVDRKALEKVAPEQSQ